MDMYITLRKIIRLLRGVEAHTMDVREIPSKKRTIEIHCTHLIISYVRQNFIRDSFLEIELCIDVIDGNRNMI